MLLTVEIRVLVPSEGKSDESFAVIVMQSGLFIFAEVLSTVHKPLH